MAPKTARLGTANTRRSDGRRSAARSNSMVPRSSNSSTKTRCCTTEGSAKLIQNPYGPFGQAFGSISRIRNSTNPNNIRGGTKRTHVRRGHCKPAISAVSPHNKRKKPAARWLNTDHSLADTGVAGWLSRSWVVWLDCAVPMVMGAGVESALAAESEKYPRQMQAAMSAMAATTAAAIARRSKRFTNRCRQTA